MTLTQLGIGLIIFILFFLRPVTYRLCAEEFKHTTSAAFSALWLFAGIVLSLPFLGYLLIEVEIDLATDYWLFIVSGLKGVLLWYGIKITQFIRKESLSSSVFLGFISLGIAALINNLFFGEVLTQTHLTSLLALGIISLFFFIYGHAKAMSREAKIASVVILIFQVFWMTSDQLVITRTNWYFHLCCATVMFLAMSLVERVSLSEWKACLTNKKSIVAGLVYVISEFAIIASMITIMPVSFAVLFTRFAAPCVMVYSALRHHEKTWKEQLVFGTIVFIAALPIILLR